MKLSLLTAAQIAHYHTEGYVLPGRIMDDATLETFRREEARFRGDPGAGDAVVSGLRRDGLPPPLLVRLR
jgi:hypothetical protein